MERSKGGRNTFGNLVIVHEQCHYSMHYGGKYDEWKTYLEKREKEHPRQKPQKKKENGNSKSILPNNYFTSSDTSKNFGLWSESNL